jgi:hypothetical protein
MKVSGWTGTGISVYIACVMATAAPAAQQTTAPAKTTASTAATTTTPTAPSVPKKLKPMLAPRQSEFRLVTQRYTLDRATLHGNYLDGFRTFGGGRPGTTASAPAEPLSASRLARLKRFDLDWQAALAALDQSSLSPAARADVTTLSQTIVTNLAQLETDAATRAQLLRAVPFAPAVVDLVEARIRIADLDPETAAGTLTQITRAIAAVKATLEAGLATPTAAGAVRLGPAQAKRAAVATTQLRAALTEWYGFQNGYDPLFTWWMGVPFKRVDAALQDYATFLAERVAATPNVADEPAAPVPAITPADAPTFASVPDLRELIALPQDEMAPIVAAFMGPQPRQGPGAPPPSAGSAPAAPASLAAPVRDATFYRGWLAALKTLDFKTLSRPAQVDYLYIRTIAEQQLARAGRAAAPPAPRKTDDTGIGGTARGRQGLIDDLQDEMIPYTPEELITFAETEFAWCEGEMKKASNAMGLGDNWKAALERVKGMHPPPGGQRAVVRDLMFDAVDYLRARDLVTVPAVAAESLHMIMMTPERQLVNPFFTGGTLISVSYPTDTMEYDVRVQGLRGNSLAFSHATAFHEMIPGHNLVFYSGARFNGYRARLGSNTPFYAEGWPLYWELLLYDLGYQATPEQKVGALFWRMHRCARIVFSLKFHMGEWSPQECVDFLVSRVGFERENAMGEVRRSFNGSYPPLYQAAYLLGGLQLRSLRHELVDSGAMPQKRFHDEILRQGAMPIAMLRLALTTQPLTPATKVDWRFLDRH